jgi:hypothetical protein
MVQESQASLLVLKFQTLPLPVAKHREVLGRAAAPRRMFLPYQSCLISIETPNGLGEGGAGLRSAQTTGKLSASATRTQIRFRTRSGNV